MGGKTGELVKTVAVTAVVVGATIYAGAAVAAYLGVTSAIGVAMVTSGVSIAVSYAVSKLMGTPTAGGGGEIGITADIGSYATNSLQNVNKNVAIVPQIYGEVMVGGNVVWRGNPINNTSIHPEEFLISVIVLADHEIWEVRDIYYKNMDKKFTKQFDSANNITTGYNEGCSYGGTERTCYMFVNIYQDGRGSGALEYIYGRDDTNGNYQKATLAVDSDWQDFFIPKNKAICIFTHVFSDVKGVENTNNAHPSFHIRGRKIQEIDSNGSLGVWSYTNSASYIILDYLRRVYPISDTYIDFQGFIDAHSHCENRHYEINVSLSSSSNAVSILQEFLQACNGILLFTRQGKYKLVIFEGTTTSIANLGKGAYLQNSLMISYGKTATLPNKITVSWIDPANKWQVVETSCKRDELIDLEGLHEQKLNLACVTNSTQAKNIADTIFQKARFRDDVMEPPINITFDTTTALEKSEVGDVFHLTNSLFVHKCIILKILSKEITQNGKITINASEYCSTHFII